MTTMDNQTRMPFAQTPASQTSKRGSALLIVLGFLSFMVVSAVSFSIYMRSERMPSSALRRTTAAKHLVWAGLARAMSEIDEALSADPFPGTVKNNSRRISALGNLPSNFWLGRVFMPPEPLDAGMTRTRAISQRKARYDAVNYEIYEQSPIIPIPRLDGVVPVLTLEGLGYVPPPLVNDVRFLGRKSFTSKWKYFNFDAGRYAYVAVNVSDYFDINKIHASTNRTSANPVSLDYLFQGGQGNEMPDRHKDVGDVKDGTVSQVEYFLSSRGSTGGGAQYPFISMLDYNLALGHASSLPPNFISPFYEYIGTKGARLYQSGGTSLDHYRQQMFVTASHFPANSGSKHFLDSGYQPLALSMGGTHNLADLEGECFDAKYKENFNLSLPDFANLLDYLDYDDIPTSLALPCTEANPMICAIQPQPLSLVFNSGVSKITTGLAPGVAYVDETKYSIDPLCLQTIVPKLAVAFPFKRIASGTRNVQLVAKLFFVDAGAAGNIKTRIDKSLGNVSDFSLRPANGDYSGNSQVNASHTVFTMVAAPTTVDFGASGSSNPQTYVKEVQFPQPFTAFANADDTLLMTKTVEYKYPVNPGTGAPDPTQPPVAQDPEYVINFAPVDAVKLFDGNGLSPVSGVTVGTKYPKAQIDAMTATYVPCIAVWARIMDAGGSEVSDCVPATFFDDNEFNGINNDFSGLLVKNFVGNLGSGFEPLMKFVGNGGGTPLSFSTLETAAAGGSAIPHTWAPESLFVCDPRYNWAPEHWYSVASPGSLDAKWEQDATALAEKDEHSGDVFMFVSNQGYLQSMSELAFLPRMLEYGLYPTVKKSGGPKNDKKLTGVLNDGALQSGVATYDTSPNARPFMWKTYEVYDIPGLNRDDSKGDWPDAESDGLYGEAVFGLGIADRKSGFYVNPYTDNTNLFMAALANTPYDWSMASARSSDDMSKPSKYLDCAFGKKNSIAKLDYDDMLKIAQNMMGAFYSEWKSGNKDWRRVYDEFDWGDTGVGIDPFDGTNFRNDLDSVDRKFLYGFWRNCFANKQQLFLVFVRAEPAAMGGGAQLGGRAVALVWRDPSTPEGESESGDYNKGREQRVPHQMRVLFYHQFE